MGRLRFEELGKAPYKDNRNLVVSKAYDEQNNVIGYAVSIQLVENAGQKTEKRVFLKDGIGIVSPEALLRLADMLSYVCYEEHLLSVDPEEGKTPDQNPT